MLTNGMASKEFLLNHNLNNISGARRKAFFFTHLIFRLIINNGLGSNKVPQIIKNACDFMSLKAAKIFGLFEYLYDENIDHSKKKFFTLKES